MSGAGSSVLSSSGEVKGTGWGMLVIQEGILQDGAAYDDGTCGSPTKDEDAVEEDPDANALLVLEEVATAVVGIGDPGGELY